MNKDRHDPAPGVSPDTTPDISSDISVDEPDSALPPATLDDLPQSLKNALANAGWKSLMPVQERALPYLMQGRDLMVQSKTGSGKTGAFLLPALTRLDPEEKQVQALILVPTRELAVQVVDDAQLLFTESGLSAAALYGGVGYGRQIEALKNGVSLVVGTPGRILDHLLRRTLSLDHLKMLIFDEADRMLSIGFYPDMKAIQRYLPKRRIPTHFFSATFPPHVMRLAGEFMDQADLLSLSSKEVHISEIEHAYYQVKPMEKDRVLVRVLEMESPSSAIIFCNTKSNVHYVTGVLRGFGFNADELSADLSQSRREEVLRDVRAGKVRFLVATDVAARGIDIPELSHVILYEPPEDHESYIHRAGRTARAGAGGTVISLVDLMQKMELIRIAKQYGITLSERQTPDDDALSTVVGERLTTILESRLRGATGLARERFSRFLPLVRELAGDTDTAPMLALLLDELYQAALHADAPVPVPEERGSSRASSRNTGRSEGRNEGGRGAGRDRERGGSRRESGDSPAAQEATDGEARKKSRRRRRKPHTNADGNESASGNEAAGDQGEE